jgi:predicted DNA binding protein
LHVGGIVRKVGAGGWYYNPDSPLSKLLKTAYAMTIQEIDEPASSPFVPPYRPRRLTPKEVKSVIERYVSGDSAAKLARDLGVHKHTMQAILGKAGVKRPFRILDQNQIDEAVDLYG